ncbi:DUF2235 domain-containing protein [Flavobacterium sp. LHD-80]|uniref:phospholipase effector Tle1 domain-containing protein n=1 Tax=Flavobacterium sp. LHD-80 TaxID=3071411 RepID=UPI0027E036BF|nr:DUF2235 domain-containing protein [Flavobacterium sp. LHD-80]MDQ6472679.1 DUF2235 domain-containing protein [Flavobacterium sp. LHD-80]
MSKITICGGSIMQTSKGKTTFEVTDGDCDFYASNNCLLEGGEATIYHDYVASEPEKDDLDDFKTGVKVIAAIFFDGTNNNRTNTEHRLGKTDTYAKMGEKGSSYDNYYSNIAIMEKMKINEPKKRIVSKYIEGEGTEDSQKGDNQGLGFGSGTTGIPAKVEKGKNKIREEINKAFTDKEYVQELSIDVFGFSRGAAAARSFMTTQKAALQKTYPKAKISYRFVGLFDTVSSFEPEGNFSVVGSAVDHNFYNDVDELKLQLGGMAKKIVHLTAADEYRKNFALTNINSSILAGVGYEVQLPGSHSDIGGGYEETKTLETRIYSGEIVKTNGSERFYYHQLIEKGWYKEEQLELSPTYANFFGTRKIANHYQFIPLSIMMEMAKKYGVSFLTFDSKIGFKKFKVIPELENIKEALQNYVLANDGAGKKVVRLQPFSELKQLRNKHLHISLEPKSMTMDPNFENGKLKRHVIDA